MLVLSGIDLNPRSAIGAVAATPTGTVIAWETGDVFDQAPEPKPDFDVSSQFASHLTDDQVVARATADAAGSSPTCIEGAGGRLTGGQHFSRGALYLTLQNRIYRGEILHQGTAYPGQHEAILDLELWQIVQDKLTANRRERSLAVGAEAPSLLAGLIVDSDGNRMTPTHATKKVKRYRYYVSAPLLAGEGLRVSAGDIEALVLDRLRALLSTRTGPHRDWGANHRPCAGYHRRLMVRQEVSP